MKAVKYVINAFQAIVISALVVYGTSIFSKYPLGVSIIDDLCRTINHIIESSELPITPRLTSQNTLTILAILLIVWGFQSVIIKGGNGRKIFLILGVLAAPSILSHSYIKWSIWINYFLGLPEEIFVTNASFTECYLYMILLVTGWLYIRLASMSKMDRRILEARGMDPEDLDKVFTASHFIIVLSLAGIFIASTIPLIPYAYINTIILQVVEQVPLGMIFLGVACSLTIIIPSYFLIKKLLATKIGHQIKVEGTMPLEHKIYSLLMKSGSMRREEIIESLSKENIRKEDVESTLMLMKRYNLITEENGEIK